MDFFAAVGFLYRAAYNKLRGAGGDCPLAGCRILNKGCGRDRYLSRDGCKGAVCGSIGIICSLCPRRAVEGDRNGIQSGIENVRNGDVCRCVCRRIARVFNYKGIRQRSVFGDGCRATDFEIERRGAPPAVTVSVAVTGVFIPSPLADTVLTIVPPAASGANPLTSAL